MSTTGRKVPAPATPPPAAPTELTSAGEFRQAGLYRLPNAGYVVRLRWPGLYALALQGELRNPIANEVMKFISGADDAPASAEETEEAKLARYRSNARAFLGVAQRCLDYPRLVLDRDPNYDAGEIGPGDLHEQDVFWIFVAFVQEGPAAEAVRAFRVDERAA